MPVVTIFYTTTGAGTFLVPADFQSFVSVEAIGGGGTQGIYWAGGGGAYAKSTSMSLTAGQLVYMNVGVAGSGTSNGGDSWVNSVSNAPPTTSSQGVLAKGALYVASLSPSFNGGDSTSCVGDVKYSGGGGGAQTSINGEYGGGGGAAGPLGIGKQGGYGYKLGSGGTAEYYGGGGGGAGGGSSTAGFTGNPYVAGSNSGNGGSGFNGTGGGNKAFSGGAAQAGTALSGGGGGAGFKAPSYDAAIYGNGANGGTGSGFTSSAIIRAGPGGGGGGSGIGWNGGNGGLYGGGAGGSSGTPSVAGQGIIVFTYNASSGFLSLLL